MSHSSLTERAATGLVGKPALESPDTLLVVRYLPEGRMDPAQRERVTRFATHGKYMQFAPVLLRLLVPVGVILTLMPLVLFVTTITRLSAVGRERRLSALRLAGATRGQVGYITAVESLLSSIGGVLAGLLLFFAARLPVTRISDTGQRWYLSDLDPGPFSLVATIVGVPLLVAVSTQLTLVRVNTSPLGTARRTRPHRLRIWRLAPLLLCLVGSAGLVMTGQQSAITGTAPIAMVTLIATLSLLPAGPYLTLLLGKLIMAGTGSRLLAGARIVDDPRGAFRAVATVMFAIFTATVFTATTPAAVASALPDNRLSGLQAGVATTTSATAKSTTDLVDRLRYLPGISGVAAIYEGRAAASADTGNNSTVWIIDCTTAIRLVQIRTRSCGGRAILVTDQARASLERATTLQIANLAPNNANATAAMVTLTLPVTGFAQMTAPAAYDTPAFLIPSALVDTRKLARLRPNKILVRYKSPGALEQARTVIDHTAPGQQLLSGPETVIGNTEGARRVRAALLIATLAIFGLAGAGLAISTSIALLQRRRQYALLRMTGVPVSTLRRAMLWETAAPLATAGLLATGLGLVVANALLGANSLTLPVAWALVWPPLAGFLLALAMTCCALPLIRRVTDTEDVRFEH